MDHLICPSLSHTHYWYEGGMLKVPASSAFANLNIIAQSGPVSPVILYRSHWSPHEGINDTLEMSLFRVFCTITVFSLYGAYVARFYVFQKEGGWEILCYLLPV